MAQLDAYLLGRAEGEVDRLRRQVAELEQDTEWLLDRLNIQSGARAVDIGCGPAAGALPQLAKRVGPAGLVVGLERGQQFAELARQYLRDLGVTNAEVREADAYDTDLPRASFDIAHMRLVLVNVPEPERMVAEMVALVRPGGMVASQEADFVGHLCDPPHAAWSRLLDAYHAYTRARGIDLFIGRRTHRLFRAAGVVDLHVDPIVRAFPLGQPRRMIIWQFIGNVRDQMVAEGFIGDAEMTALMAELKAHLDDPDTLVTGLFQFRGSGVVSRADQRQPSRAGQWSRSSCMLGTRLGQAARRSRVGTSAQHGRHSVHHRGPSRRGGAFLAELATLVACDFDQIVW